MEWNFGFWKMVNNALDRIQIWNWLLIIKTKIKYLSALENKNSDNNDIWSKDKKIYKTLFSKCSGLFFLTLSVYSGVHYFHLYMIKCIRIHLLCWHYHEHCLSFNFSSVIRFLIYNPGPNVAFIVKVIWSQSYAS